MGPKAAPKRGKRSPMASQRDQRNPLAPKREFKESLYKQKLPINRPSGPILVVVVEEKTMWS